MLLAQPSLFDSSRAPVGKHTAWAYCHVPNGSKFDMLPRLEDQIERFAPGFRDVVLGHHVSSPATLEKMDANLLGGDISGGVIDLRQMLFVRPQSYMPHRHLIFSYVLIHSSGGGVHGMCGYHAAKTALARLRQIRETAQFSVLQVSFILLV